MDMFNDIGVPLPDMLSKQCSQILTQLSLLSMILGVKDIKQSR